MAQKVEVTLIDDLDGSNADETISFGLGGTRYEIDLSGKNATALRETLAPYVAVARKVSGSQKAGRGGARPVAPVGPKTADVREWAKAEGIQISERGRIAAGVIVKFQEAH
ncbi:MAG TPA: Lsr2 family protein [Actinocrinis sp.]|jgi:hypothetical protein|uniref:histone-like nucleoid-structuring protein Lsr2 n=1 Tax=Actinocrinis sp. TaxID=1920516 RepID=UPI002DDCA832|nr:Lsr2 family protein [Actinocrinis sp.]HEV3170386.1 Lsr2 family protein [Actinocrinis sp.]